MKKFAFTLAVVLLLMTITPTALACCGGYGWGYGQPRSAGYGYCTVDDCGIGYLHQHGRTWYYGAEQSDSDYSAARPYGHRGGYGWY